MFLTALLFDVPAQWAPVRIYGWNLFRKNYRDAATVWWKLHNPNLKCFWLCPSPVWIEFSGDINATHVCHVVHLLYCDVTLTYCAVLSQNWRSCNTFILNPYVHMLDDNNACIAFTRLTQYVDGCVSYAEDADNTSRCWSRLVSR